MAYQESYGYPRTYGSYNRGSYTQGGYPIRNGPNQPLNTSYAAPKQHHPGSIWAAVLGIIAIILLAITAFMVYTVFNKYNSNVQKAWLSALTTGGTPCCYSAAICADIAGIIANKGVYTPSGGIDTTLPYVDPTTGKLIYPQANGSTIIPTPIPNMNTLVPTNLPTGPVTTIAV